MLAVIVLLWRRRQDSNLRPTFTGDPLARDWFEPLTHVSKCAAFGTPPEPQTVPTYVSDGIAIRIPAPSIPDQGPTGRSLTLNELVEVFSEGLDRGGGRCLGERLELTLSKVGIATDSITFLVPLLKEDVLRVVEKVVPNIITSCHFLLLCVCEMPVLESTDCDFKILTGLLGT